MKPRKKPELSAQQIANVANVSLTLVHRKLNEGKTAKTIIYEAVAREQRAAQRSAVNIEVAEVANPSNGHAANGVLSFAAAQASKENALAELRQLELMERRQELLPLTYLKIWASRFLVEGRDILMNGPGELADKLAMETDPRAVEEVLQAWVDRSMQHFFRLENLWGGGGEPLDEAGLRERFDAARLATVKPPRR